MDKYVREADVKLEDPNHPPTANEIRVTTAGNLRSFITYASKKLQDNTTESITLKAMGRAIHKTVLIAEIIKRRFPNLHQVTQIDSTLIPETYHPKEDGLDPVKTTRNVSSILITLYNRPPDTNTIGYQAPEAQSATTQTRTNVRQNRGPRQRRGRGGGGGVGGGRNRKNDRPINSPELAPPSGGTATNPPPTTSVAPNEAPKDAGPKTTQTQTQPGKPIANNFPGAAPAPKTTFTGGDFRDPQNPRRGRGGRGRGGRGRGGRGRGRGRPFGVGVGVGVGG